jgi:succinate dehydrogenase hydrophobic anchor subunit
MEVLLSIGIYLVVGTPIILFCMRKIKKLPFMAFFERATKGEEPVWKVWFLILLIVLFFWGVFVILPNMPHNSTMEVLRTSLGIVFLIVLCAMIPLIFWLPGALIACSNNTQNGWIKGISILLGGLLTSVAS